MPGVIRTRVGYAGGTKSSPTYHDLGDHSETIQIDYDPDRITYRDLLGVFWKEHDPSRRSWSRQYAAIIFYHDAEQKRLAEETKSEVAAQTGRTVLTEIVSFRTFTLAEDYHQKHALRLNREFLEEMQRFYPATKDLIDSTAAARLNGFLGGEGSSRDLEKVLDELSLSPRRKEALRNFVTRRSGAVSCPVRR